MTDLKTIKQSTSIINKLFERDNFFTILCSVSNNNIEEVINNIYLIINYYLSTQDIIYTYPIQELLNKAKEIPPIEGIIFHPTNSFYEKRYKVLGLNSTPLIEDSSMLELEAIEYQISFTNKSSFTYCAEITPDIKEAINLSHTSPQIVYKSILKQPSKKELPMVVGTKETNYYRSILDIRLKNIKETYRKTVSKKTTRMLKRYIGKDSLLVLFPISTKNYTITKKDISNKETPTYIPSKYLSFIRIPSRYKLLSICSENKQIRNGELLDIYTGEPYQKKEEQPPRNYYLYYSRYELLSITDEFEYSNSELTQDINYDIDLIYGTLDTNHSREKTLKDPLKNIEQIKSTSDIQVRKLSNKYHIRNGRHRLLYLKYFYVSNYQSYKDSNNLDKLKQLVNIPTKVEHTIETPSINRILSNIKELNLKSLFLKSNINNDYPELIIIYEDKVYITKNEYELASLYNLLSLNITINKYLIGTNTYEDNINYEELFDYLIITLKEKLYTMSLTDIIEYITKEGFYQNDQYYLVDTLNYYYLYYEYIDFQHSIQIKQIFNRPITIVEETEEKLLKKHIGERIMSIIRDNPDLLSLEWKDFYSIISKMDEFKEYDIELLERAATYAGYQKERLMQFYANEPYAKRPLL